MTDAVIFLLWLLESISCGVLVRFAANATWKMHPQTPKVIPRSWPRVQDYTNSGERPRKSTQNTTTWLSPMWWEAATFFTLLSLKPTLMLLNPTPLSSSPSALWIFALIQLVCRRQRRLKCASVPGLNVRARECHASLAHSSATNRLGSLVLWCLITAVCFLLYVAALFRDSVGQHSEREALDASVAPNHCWIITKFSPFGERRANSHI